MVRRARTRLRFFCLCPVSSCSLGERARAHGARQPEPGLPPEYHILSHSKDLRNHLPRTTAKLVTKCVARGEVGEVFREPTSTWAQPGTLTSHNILGACLPATSVRQEQAGRVRGVQLGRNVKCGGVVSRAKSVSTVPMDGKMDYGPQPPMAAGGGPDAAAQFYTSKYIRSPRHFAVDVTWGAACNRSQRS